MPSKLAPLARELSLPYYDDAIPEHDIYRIENRTHQLASITVHPIQSPEPMEEKLDD